MSTRETPYGGEPGPGRSGGHLDPDLLALVALGERLADPDRDAHAASCAVCQVEIEQLSAVVATGRRVTIDDIPIAAPASVWAAITSELGLSGNARPFVPAAEVRVEVERAIAPIQAEVERLRVISLDAERDARRWRTRARRGIVMAGAAAAVVGVVGGGVVGSVTRNNDTPTPSAPVVASAQLASLPGKDGTGFAKVFLTSHGEQIHVDVSGLPRESGFYQVWLLDKAANRMYSLGALGGGEAGDFDVPAGVSVSDYPVVDISLQPTNGNPAHSKNSFVRGTLKV